MSSLGEGSISVLGESRVIISLEEQFVKEMVGSSINHPLGLTIYLIVIYCLFITQLNCQMRVKKKGMLLSDQMRGQRHR